MTNPSQQASMLTAVKRIEDQVNVIIDKMNDLIMETQQMPTDFNKPQDPPAWAYIDPRPGVTSPLDFRKIAWMRRANRTDGGKTVIDLCFIGGEPIELHDFSQRDAENLVIAWQDYRVGLPTIASKGNINDRSPR